MDNGTFLLWAVAAGVAWTLAMEYPMLLPVGIGLFVAWCYLPLLHFDPQVLGLIPALFVYASPFVLIWILASFVIKTFGNKGSA